MCSCLPEQKSVSMDSPVMWMFDGQKFQQKGTEATMYKLVGDVTTCMFCALLAQIVSPLLSTLNNLVL